MSFNSFFYFFRMLVLLMQQLQSSRRLDSTAKLWNRKITIFGSLSTSYCNVRSFVADEAPSANNVKKLRVQMNIASI
ncbi:hypothetical protein D1AOALGA4SA_3058 [Olavius algarvensis Delta 1 endosymbiont]|nr:hypothetical protein D1AOALGA4SA_3058 [Olavius algarvensis Delta 1 endosymbiont]